MTEISLAAIERIIRKAGAERISYDAIVALSEILEDIGIRISKDALELAKHAKRKTIKKEDVKLAVKRIDI